MVVGASDHVGPDAAQQLPRRAGLALAGPGVQEQVHEEDEKRDREEEEGASTTILLRGF